MCPNRGDRRFLQYETPRPRIRGCCLYTNSTPYLYKEDTIAKCTLYCARRKKKASPICKDLQLLSLENLLEHFFNESKKFPPDNNKLPSRLQLGGVWFMKMKTIFIAQASERKMLPFTFMELVKTSLVGKNENGFRK